MKAIYTILFFVDTLLLVGLTYLFLKLMDTGASEFTFALTVFAIIACVSLLVYFLSHYIKLPSANDKK